MNLHRVEKNDKLFFRILAASLTLYIITIAICIKNKKNSGRIVPSKLKINRFTKVIVDIKIPKPKPKAIQKIEPPAIVKEKKVEVVEKKVVKKVVKKKKPKAIVKPKRVVKTVNPKIKKETEQDLNDFGILKVLGSMDYSVGGLNSDETIELASNNDFLDIKDDSNLLFDEEMSEDILAESTLSNSESDNLATELLEKNEITFDDKIKIENSKSYVDLAVLQNKKIDEDGSRTPHFIEEKVSQYADGIKFCYSNRLGLDKKPSGKILINFTILPSGNTEGIKIVSNDIMDVMLNRCIEDLVGRWEFPTSSADKVLVTYPLYLSPDKY